MTKYQSESPRRRIIEICRQTDSKTVGDCILWRSQSDTAPAQKPETSAAVWELVSLIEQTAHQPPETLEKADQNIQTWITLNAEAAKRFKIIGTGNIIESIAKLDPEEKTPFLHRQQQEAKP